MGRIICGIDIETTGLDHEKDCITEIAWVIRDTDDPKPFFMGSYFVSPSDFESFEISDEIYALTKITKRHLANGRSLESLALQLLHDVNFYGVEAMVAHNGAYFDKPFLLRKLIEVGSSVDTVREKLDSILWVDTYTDVPYPAECKSSNLTFLSAFHGFLNPFPHAALSDVQTMLRILSHYEIDTILERALSPWTTLRAMVSFEKKDLAKARRYYWERTGDGATLYPKQWVKRVRMLDVQKEKVEAPFEVREVL